MYMGAVLTLLGGAVRAFSTLPGLSNHMSLVHSFLNISFHYLNYVRMVVKTYFMKQKSRCACNTIVPLTLALLNLLKGKIL